MRRVALTTHLAAPPAIVRAALMRSALLRHVARPLLAFRPVDPPAFPAIWEEDGRYRVALRLFGLVPLGQQVIAFERPPADRPAERFRDAGHGTLARRWDHVIEITPDGGGTRYTDRVEIEAGALTGAVALFARLFYAHRQRRLRALARAGFAALDG